MDRVNQSNEENKVLREYFYRYFSFWPYFIFSIIFCLISGFIYLRYSTNIYKSIAKIEIIDKAQDSEMALPTSMTIFNRSLINLENEIGVLRSYELNRRVVSKLKSYVRFYSVGNFKNKELHRDELFSDYELKMDENMLKFSGHKFILSCNNNKLIIKHENRENIIKSYSFDSLTSKNSKHNLPFEITLNSLLKSDTEFDRIISIGAFEKTVQNFISKTEIVPSGTDSDQLVLSFINPNKMISAEFLNTLINEFDQDGIEDRRSQYLLTINFVDTRSKIIQEELVKVEDRKKEYKVINSIADISSSTSATMDLKFQYDSEMFDARSQQDLLSILIQTIDENIYKILPMNIGLANQTINELINNYNLKIQDYERFKVFAGQNNSYFIRIKDELNDLQESILKSISNYNSSLEKTIANLNEKQGEYDALFKNLPENEKTLRAIERELNVKEALFLLLLQKKEEAAINYAVIKPSIKVVDFAKVLESKVYPNNAFIYLVSLITGLLIPFSIISIIFFFDNKIHTKKQLEKELNDDIPIIGEIPQIIQTEALQLSNSISRDPLSESIRMVISNSEFIKKDNLESGKIFLVTSSIKGEGKTLVSTHFASLMSENKKVLLVGLDLRNPQIHKIMGIKNKNRPGLTNYLVEKSIKKDIESYIIKKDNLDILLSGIIPPNPTQLISSDKLGLLLNQLRKKYDAIVLDTAPCLVVSDSFGLSNFIDQTLYVFRANHTDVSITAFINEIQELSKFKNLSVILNGIGNSEFYGYKYGYQYGYKYGYKYNYNYGYGYGYGKSLS